MARVFNTTKRKTDNRSIGTKLYLRKRILAEAKFDELRVLDLCAGEGHIWQAMRRHTNIVSYLPCDRAPRIPGTVKGEAEVLIRGIDLSRFNVIDADTYGEPWKLWLEIAGRITKPTAVFLTHGSLNSGDCSQFARETAGMPAAWSEKFAHWNGRTLQDFCGRVCLEAGAQRCQVLRCLWVSCNKTADGSVSRGSRADYYGLLCDAR